MTDWIHSHTIVAATLVVGMGTGAAIDIATRRIPNAVSFGTAIAGIALAATGLSHVGVAASVTGMLLAGLLLRDGNGRAAAFLIVDEVTSAARGEKESREAADAVVYSESNGASCASP